MNRARTFLRRTRSPLAFAFCLSFLFHLFFILRDPKEKAQVDRVIHPSIKMNVRLVSKTKEKEKEKEKEEIQQSSRPLETIKRRNRTGPSSLASHAGSKDAGSPSREAIPKIATYQDLLPGSYSLSAGAGEERLSGGGDQGGPDARRPYEGNKRSELKTENSLLSASFDLPLVLRRSISSGRARARIKEENGEIVIAQLGGKPEIRAALLECLQSPGSLEKLRRILRYFQSSSFQLTIEFSTENIADSPREFETSHEVFDKEIVIRMIRFPAYAVAGADPNALTTIDDEDSKKARERDRRHRSKLYDSPAYKHSLRNFPLRASTQRTNGS